MNFRFVREITTIVGRIVNVVFDPRCVAVNIVESSDSVPKVVFFGPDLSELSYDGCHHEPIYAAYMQFRNPKIVILANSMVGMFNLNQW